MGLEFGSSSRSARIALGLAIAGLAACGGDGGGSDRGSSGELTLSLAVCDPSAGTFSLGGANPFFPLDVGRRLVLEGEEDGEALTVVITVLGDTEVVAGVTTRVVEERETVDGELVEVSRNFVAETPDATICYFGEDVTDFENGEAVPAEDAWRAGVNGAAPGILLPGNPRVGDRYAQESAPGVAEDRAEVVSLGDSVTVPAGTFSDTLTTVEENPLEPDGDPSTKIYARGIGLIVDDAVELVASE